MDLTFNAIFNGSWKQETIFFSTITQQINSGQRSWQWKTCCRFWSFHPAPVENNQLPPRGKMEKFDVRVPTGIKKNHQAKALIWLLGKHCHQQVEVVARYQQTSLSAKTINEKPSSQQRLWLPPENSGHGSSSDVERFPGWTTPALLSSD